MNEIEHRRGTGDVLKHPRVPHGASLEVGEFDWHGANLAEAQSNLRQQTVAYVGEVPVRVSGRGHALIHLRHAGAAPRDILAGQRP